MKKTAPPPPDILRKSGPHKDKKKYDRKKVKREDVQRDSGTKRDDKDSDKD